MEKQLLKTFVWLVVRAMNLSQILLKLLYPLSGETLPIFNSRTQSWFDNFEWSPDSTKVEGLTAVGRATIITLRMNNPVIIVARKRWTINNWHPPID